MFPSVRRIRYNQQVQGDHHAPEFSLLEQAFKRIGQELMLRPTFPKRTYVAIVDRGDDVPLGVAGLIESQSVHVIAGTW